MDMGDRLAGVSADVYANVVASGGMRKVQPGPCAAEQVKDRSNLSSGQFEKAGDVTAWDGKRVTNRDRVGI
jgi:hypothetical protein